MQGGGDVPVLTLKDLPSGSGAPQFYMTPALSADGTRVALTARTGATDRLYAAPMTGGTPVQVSPEADAVEYGPTWTPDGSAVACIRQTGIVNSLVVMRLGTADPPRELAGTLRALPEWSPTGQWIAAATEENGLELLDPAGGPPKQLDARCDSLAWAPDGRTLYCEYADEAGATVTGLDVLSGKAGPPLALGDHAPASEYSPGKRISVTPDGKALVYAVLRKHAEIWILDGLQVPAPWYSRLLPAAITGAP
jgi:hypothetical protein